MVRSSVQTCKLVWARTHNSTSEKHDCFMSFHFDVRVHTGQLMLSLDYQLVLNYLFCVY